MACRQEAQRGGSEGQLNPEKGQGDRKSYLCCLTYLGREKYKICCWEDQRCMWLLLCTITQSCYQKTHFEGDAYGLLIFYGHQGAESWEIKKTTEYTWSSKSELWVRGINLRVISKQMGIGALHVTKIAMKKGRKRPRPRMES